MSIPGLPPGWARGSTLRFRTTFFDFDGNIVQPGAATLVVFYYDAANPEGVQEEIAMTPPTAPAVQWTALLDTRNMAAPRRLEWSIFSAPPSMLNSQPPPFAVEDGYLDLKTNDANQVTF